MINFIKNKVVPLALTSGIFVGISYGYIYYQCQKNKREYDAILEAGTIKDASRLTNDSFGISWGFQADDTVMKQIDSGDYIFMKYDCSQCLNPENYIHCLYDSALRLEEQFDSVGYTYRSEQGLFVIFNEFGNSRVVSYAELVGLPFIKELMIQKNSIKDISIHKKLRKLLSDQNGEISYKTMKESSIDLVNRVNKVLFEDYMRVIDLKQLLESQKQIYVRTDTNRTLRSL